LTPLLAPLPEVTLAAILIYGGWNLVEFQAMKRIYRHYPNAAGIAALTTLGVLAAGVVAGILLGVILSLLTLITRISHPPDAVLREVPGHGFHDVGETLGRLCRGCWPTDFTRRYCSPIAAIFRARPHLIGTLLRQCDGSCWTPRRLPTSM